MGKDNLLYKMCALRLVWSLRQQTFTTFRGRYKLPWYAASLGELKGRITWGEVHREVTGVPQESCPAPGDKRLCGYRDAFPPMAGGAETLAPPVPA